MIENVTDQFNMYVNDVAGEFDRLKDSGIPADEALKILEIAAHTMNTEVLHHYYKSLYDGEIQL